MPTRSKLVALTQALRHARTGLVPIDIAERVQHTIVRIEQMLASPVVDVAAADAITSEARKLLDECETFGKS
jgi:hypothetical protein